MSFVEINFAVLRERADELLALLRRIWAAVDQAEIDEAARCAAELTAKYSPQEREWANQLLQDAIAEHRQKSEHDV
jgi:hypothetical protein